MTQPIQRVEDLFQRAADLPQGERAAFLERECPDPELRARVWRLLRRHEEGESFVVPLFDPGDAPSEGPGTVIGRYKLLQHIGEGGFGVVYMAEQSAPVVRKVALKIIKLGMDTKEVVARFEAERQALALMEHENIAKVLDGGATETGRPYFVMELVRGIAITEYCDQNNLTTSERLELFVLVCQAVQHAHQKGVIHRDLKPSNVLVTLHDGKPVPKVIDFGIAKAMHGRLTEKTLFTEFRQFIGTPAYMSPEQAEMSGLDIDTRTDIYSLGVLLYELLTGSTPFDTKALLEAGYGELQRIIREKEPPRPSVRISTQGSAEIARHRRVDVHALSRLLRGDLDWIAMRALEKDRARRYASASELAEDVRRHMRDEPVLAGPPGTAYRVKKFLARNRAAVAWMATIAVALLAGIAGTTWGVWRAAREHEESARNRVLAETSGIAAERAQREAGVQGALARQAADRARDVTGFLTETLALSNPMISGSASLPVRDVLDRASQQVARLSDQPYAEASVRGTIGRAYRSLSEHALAEPHLRRAAELMRELPDFDGIERYQTLWALTITLYGLGASDAAEAALEARAVGHDQVRELHPELAGLLDRFIQAVEHMEVDTASELFARARAATQAEFARGDPLWTIWVGSLQHAGYDLWFSPLEARAEPFWAEAYAIQERELGPANPETAETLAMLAGVLNRSGRASEAEARVRESVRIMRSVFGAEHVQTAFSELMLGENLAAQERFTEAEPIVLAASQILTAVHDESNFCPVYALDRVVALYDAWRQPDKAAPARAELATRCASGSMMMPYSLLRGLFGEAAAVRTGLDQLQGLADLLGQAPPAAPREPVDIGATVEGLLAGSAQRWDAGHPMTALLGRMFVLWSRALEGIVRERDRERLSAAALEKLQAWRGHVPPEELADALALRAEFALHAGDRTRATEVARQAWDAVRGSEAAGAAHKERWNAALARLRVGCCLHSIGLEREAEELLLAAHRTLLAQLGPNHAHTRHARAALYDLYTALSRPAEAAPFADSASR
jgi:tetratricopeptide (TPR) repeat protein